MIYTFWEGPMPDYIRLCMDTWRQPYTVLTFATLHEYTDLPVTDKLKRFSLPMIADAVRAHVLRDQGGYWLDADTIMLSDELPTENIKGYKATKDHTWGFLYADRPGLEFFKFWSEYQDKVIADPTSSTAWPVLCKDFTDPYIKGGGEVTIADITTSWPETYMADGVSRRQKYQRLYFEKSFHLDDFKPTDILMLHNSWTPEWYKQMPLNKLITCHCTMSNILREVLE